MVFKSTTNDGFSNEFYAINSKELTKKTIYSGTDIEKQKHLNFEINYILKHSYLYTNVWEFIQFEKKVMYQPSTLSLINVGDTIYLFDHSLGNLDIYCNNLAYIRSIKIDYHLIHNWNKNIIHDQVENKVYTTITDDNFEVLYEISLIDGSIQARYKIPFLFPYKVMVNSGYVFVLYKEFTNQSFHKSIYSSKL